MSEITVSRYDFEIHPCAKIFPELTADEFAKLKTDIRAHGQIEPITLGADGLTLLDGRNRLKVCQQLGIPVRVEYFRPQTNLTEEDFIWSQNVARRHLTSDQRAMLSQRWADTIREAAKERQKRKPNSVLAKTPKQNPVHTRETLAGQAKVSPNKIRQAAAVLKHKPELAPKVERGEMKLSDAAKESQPPPKPAPALPAPRAVVDPLKTATVIQEEGPKPAPTPDPKLALGYSLPQPNMKKAVPWLSNVLFIFATKGYAAIHPSDMARYGPDPKILAKLTDWLQSIRAIQAAEKE